MSIDTSKITKKYIVKRDLKNIFPKEFTSRELIGKFFDYVMNNFFQSSFERYMNGYIGRKTNTLEDGNFYIKEQTPERNLYQLTPMLIDLDSETLKIKDTCDYINFINTLKMQGCLTNDQNRLLSNEHWSYCPPINVDMFLNFNFYYWVEEGIKPIHLYSVTNAVVDIIGKENYTYRYNDDYGNVKEIPFYNDMRIIFHCDSNNEYNDKPFIVEGVGKSIILVDDSQIYTDDDKSPDYFIMERGCIDGNPWSLRNRWFHINAIKMANEYNGTEEYKIEYKQAKYPILCFNRNIELYNYGDFDRGNVNIITSVLKNSIQGKVLEDGEQLTIKNKVVNDGDVIIFTDEPDEETNNMLYKVYFEKNGDSKITTLILMTNGKNPSGKPEKGEMVKLLDSIDELWFYDGNKWAVAQQKKYPCQSPLFNLYDSNGVCLSNYKSSNFEGNTIFNYKEVEDTKVGINTDLKRRLETSGYGNYVFDNTIVSKKYTYNERNGEFVKRKEIEGYKFFKYIDETTYSNSWHLSKDMITQYIMTEITITDEKDITEFDEKEYQCFDLEYIPSESSNKENLFVYLNGELLDKKTYYIDEENKKLCLLTDIGLNPYDIIFIRMLVDKIDGDLAYGYAFDLPLTLSSNAFNEDITEIKYNEMFPQLESILQNQNNFEGIINGINNYKDTKKDLSLGTKIVQHSTPILKTMMLNNKEYTNIKTVLTYINQEYTKFKNKFSVTINNMVNNGEYNEYDDNWIKTNPLSMVIKALNKMNIGKEGLQPFYNNGVAEQLINLDEDDDDYLISPYIPSTPAYLGLDNCYKPEIIYKETSGLKQDVLLCHDGSYIQVAGDYRDDALLELETQIYDSINSDFKDELPILIKQKYIPGKFRKTEYSYDDYIKLLTPVFEKWVINNNYDYSSNTTFNEYNPFTWNWSSCYDTDGEKLLGSYRAIYMYYYDTDRPHTHPWEMLGFSNRPSWWTKIYGAAPYTSENINMWFDIENGYIREGNSKGYYECFKRPGLIDNYMPVDGEGNLLNPYEAGIAKTKPILTYASENWKIGDIGMIENAWMHTSEYRYSIQEILYLMKPLEWLETSWNTLNRYTLFKDTDYEQLINIDSGIRDVQTDIEMHNELIDGNYVKKIGSQQWFSDLLSRENINITNYIASDIRNMKLNLGYRCGGFYQKDTIRLMSDNYGIIPENNYKLKLGSKINDTVFSYSAIIIMKYQDGWIIDGLDYEHPYFDIFTPKKSGKKSTVDSKGRTFIYYHEYNDKPISIKYKTKFTSAQELYNVIIGYGKYLESKGFTFTDLDENGEQIDFIKKAKEFLDWYSNPSVTDNMLILLNPFNKRVVLKHNGFADIVGKYFNGFWSINDTLPSPIYNNNLRVYRHNGYINIEPKGNINIGNVKITTSEKENVLLIDNETSYGDILYNSLKGIKTDRFKLLGVKSNGWNGTYFAPGYIINEDETIEPNYDKLANDFNYVYDSDDIRSFSDMGEEARKTIGYHKTNYMENLLIDNRNMFDFYKGMLKEKGTKKAFNKLNRSRYIMSEGSSNLQLFEHWAFNVGQFGYTKNKSATELLIHADDISHDPQLITFSSDPNYVSDDKSNIDINWNDEDWLKKNLDEDRNTFVYKDYSKKLPIGGFAQLDEADYILATKDELEDNIDNVDIGKKVWVVKDDKYTWNMYKKIDNEDKPLKSLKVKNFNELLSYNTLNLEKDDLIYVENDILENWRVRLSDDNENEISLYIKDPKGLLTNPNYMINSYAWSVFKFNGVKPESYILSMPYGLMSVYNELNKYTVKINKDILLNMPDGKDDGKNLYKTYKLENDIPFVYESNDNNEIYIFVDDKNQYYKGDKLLYNLTDSSDISELSFWYNSEDNKLSRWNGKFWQNGADKLYTWVYNGNKVYTNKSEPNNNETVYKDFNITSETKTGVIDDVKQKKYAWVYNDSLYYTLNSSPIPGDVVFDSSRVNPVDVVSSYFDGSEYFYCDNKKYMRSEDNDYNMSIYVVSSYPEIPSGEYVKTDEVIELEYYSYLGKLYVDNKNITDLDIALPYTLERVEQKPINMDIMKSIYLVDNDKNTTLSKMYLYNPLYCIIPTICNDEIDYITSYDPVSYNDPLRWYDEKLGELWWDTSKVRYLDYYQGDLVYRRNNWGKQLPGSEIAIMEWTKSTVLPDDVEKYITRVVYNPETDKNETYYYFWVKNPISIPEYDFRKTSAYDISRKINSPQSEGLIWFSAINRNDRVYDDSSFIIGNFDDVTASKDFVVQINYSNENDVDDHNEWLMIVEDSDDDIPDKLWNKMKYSLITEMEVKKDFNEKGEVNSFDELPSEGNTNGDIWQVLDENKYYIWNENKWEEYDINDVLSVPDNSLQESEKYGISERPRQTMFKNIYKARKNFVSVVNDVLSSRNVLSSSSDDLKVFTSKDTSYENIDIAYEYNSHEQMVDEGLDKSLIGFNVLVKSDELYDNIWTVWKMKGIGKYELVDYQKYDMNRYVYYIDAFLNDSYSPDTYNKKVYESTNEKELIDLVQQGIPDGTIVRIDDPETKTWLFLKQYNETTGTFYVVGIKDGYVQISDELYEYMADKSIANDSSEFIDGMTKEEYLNMEVKTVIKILCDYFYND